MSCKAEDADGLTPFKDDNETRRKIGRKDAMGLKLVDYKYRPLPPRTKKEPPTRPLSCRSCYRQGFWSPQFFTNSLRRRRVL